MLQYAPVIPPLHKPTRNSDLLCCVWFKDQKLVFVKKIEKIRSSVYAIDERVSLVNVSTI